VAHGFRSAVQERGCLAYLEPVGADSGALRVIPGSHHPQFREALRELGSTGLRDSSLPAHVVATEPGDLLLLDEHVLHASFGGGIRRQWRVDYLEEAFMRSRRGTGRSR
jgi:ectoine hydroxylase-related dioxygenase (phytanoyl-CoA dioxygenase family)